MCRQTMKPTSAMYGLLIQQPAIPRSSSTRARPNSGHQMDWWWWNPASREHIQDISGWNRSRRGRILMAAVHAKSQTPLLPAWTQPRSLLRAGRGLRRHIEDQGVMEEVSKILCYLALPVALAPSQHKGCSRGCAGNSALCRTSKSTGLGQKSHEFLMSFLNSPSLNSLE